MKRWVCPTCLQGVNAPIRPRRDDVRRYCLTCSAASGRLVERRCPALDRIRAARDASAKQKAAAKRERDQAERKARFTVDRNGEPVNLLDVLNKVRRLPAFKLYRKLPIALRVRRGVATNRAGVARYGYRSGYIIIAANTTWNADPVDTVIHECAHLLAFWHHRDGTHGRAFRNSYQQLATEWNERHTPTVEIDKRWTP